MAMSAFLLLVTEQQQLQSLSVRVCQLEENGEHGDSIPAL